MVFIIALSQLRDKSSTINFQRLIEVYLDQNPEENIYLFFLKAEFWDKDYFIIDLT